MPLISVIVPIYNVEAYLHQCVDSVLNQSFKDLEVILVDDGSPDRCPEICDAYACQDARVKVIHKENGGLSSARNCGLRAASGTYVMFLDSDDYWLDNCLETFLKMEKKWQPEVVAFPAIRWQYKENIFSAAEVSYPEWLNDASIQQVLEYLIAHDLYAGSSCKKILKREFLLKHDLFFVDGIKSEDIEWSFRLLEHVENFKFLNEAFYVYRMGRSDSITNTINEAHLGQYLEFLGVAKEKIENSVVESWRKKIILGYISYHYCILVGLANRLCVAPGLAKKLREMRIVLKYCFGKKSKMCYRVYSVLGYRGLCFVLGMYLKLR